MNWLLWEDSADSNDNSEHKPSQRKSFFGDINSFSIGFIFKDRRQERVMMMNQDPEILSVNKEDYKQH